VRDAKENRDTKMTARNFARTFFLAGVFTVTLDGKLEGILVVYKLKYTLLLKTGSMDNAIQEFSLAYSI